MPAGHQLALHAGVRFADPRKSALIRLLDRVGEGVALAQSGYITPAVVRELAAEFDWWEVSSEPRSEIDIFPLQFIRGLALDAGLVRRTHNRLVLTMRGRLARTDAGECWTQVVMHLAAEASFPATMRELLLARLLDGPSSITTIVD